MATATGQLPRRPPTGNGQQDRSVDKSFGGFLRALKRGGVDMPATMEKMGSRYVRVEKTAQNSELSGGAGGYLLPVEYTTDFLFPLSEKSLVYPRALVVPMGSAECRGPMLDATTVQAAATAPYWGGLLFKWGFGTQTFTNSETEPAFRETTLRAWDLLGYGSVTNQMLADMGPAGDAKLISLLGSAAAWYAEYAFFNGLGAGSSMPLGMLNAPCAISSTRAVSVHISNTDTAKMYGQLLPMSAMRAIWACSKSASEDLVKISGFVPNIHRHDPDDWLLGYLYNLPVYCTDKLPAIGGAGDLTLFDPSLYLIGNRMEVIVDVSDQVPGMFQENRSVYRVWLRMDGKPMLNDVVTLPDHTTEVSSVVYLEAK